MMHHHPLVETLSTLPRACVFRMLVHSPTQASLVFESPHPGPQLPSSSSHTQSITTQWLEFSGLHETRTEIQVSFNVGKCLTEILQKQNVHTHHTLKLGRSDFCSGFTRASSLPVTDRDTPWEGNCLCSTDLSHALGKDTLYVPNSELWNLI